MRSIDIVKLALQNSNCTAEQIAEVNLKFYLILNLIFFCTGIIGWWNVIGSTRQGIAFFRTWLSNSKIEPFYCC